MYEDLFNFFNNSSSSQTETEEETQTSSNPGGYVSPASQSDDDLDDYSITPNYQEETNYNSSKQVQDVPKQFEQKNYKSMYAPIIETNDEVESVTLTKQKNVIRLSGRMKIVLSMFIIIMASLMVAIVWNFVSASSLKKSIAEKQIQVTNLELSINELTREYNRLGDDDYIREQASSPKFNFVEANDSNTVKVELGDRHAKKQTPEVSSNWFNDVCDFLSKIFG